MNRISIHKKLFSLITHLVIISLAVFLLTATVLLAILSHKTFIESQNRTEENLIDKGRVLVASNSIALQGLAEENSFISMNELISSTIQKDRDIVYGIYMDNQRQPWIRVSPGFPQSKFQSLTVADDSMSIWAHSETDVAFKRVTGGAYPIYEFAAPVNVAGKRVGTIRYGISALRMRMSIQELKKEFIIEIVKYFAILLIVIAFLLLFELKAARKQADTITAPLEELTKAANQISRGDYSTEIITSTNDEIGILASDFEQMRQMIKQYTDNLEQMVDERTQQLNTSLKEQLIQANKLVTLGTLVASFAHEVNNPNNSILLSAGTVEEVWKNIQEILDEYVSENGEFRIRGYNYSELREELPATITRIINNSRRIKNIVNDLKNFSRKEYDSVKQKLNINRVINDAISIIDSEIKKFTNHFTVDLQEEIPPVYGVQQRLEQVIVNMIQNACQALDSTEKHVTIRTGYDPQNNMVVISIKDQGVGMDKETLDNLLSSFFTTKHSNGGTGLGLFVTSRIIKEHNGTLLFESEPGKGTLAKVLLPAGENGKNI